MCSHLPHVLNLLKVAGYFVCVGMSLDCLERRILFRKDVIMPINSPLLPTKYLLEFVTCVIACL